MSSEGIFVTAGEKTQAAANYVVETAAVVATYIADTAVATKDAVVGATHTAEHAAADTMRSAADKIDPEK